MLNNIFKTYLREYLATFKKTVAMHEMFLTRLAHHPVFRNDHNLRVFLEYDQDLCVRGKLKIPSYKISLEFNDKLYACNRTDYKSLHYI